MVTRRTSRASLGVIGKKGTPAGDLRRVVGTVVRDRGFFATSLRRELENTPFSGAASHLAGRDVLMNVRVPRGTPALHIPSGDESELVLAPNTKIAILSIERGFGTWVVEAQVVP